MACLLISLIAAAALALLPTAPAEAPLSLWSCGIALPSPAEVEAYVRANWPDFRDRAGLPRSWAEAGLADVGDVSCGYRHRVPSCRFAATARAASGETRRVPLAADFARDKKGGLAEVVVTGPECERRGQLP